MRATVNCLRLIRVIYKSYCVHNTSLLQLITKYGNDTNVTSLVDKFDWYFLPVANPDGYEFSHMYVRIDCFLARPIASLDIIF